MAHLKTINNPLGAGAPKGNHQKTIDRVDVAVRFEMANLGLSDGMIAKAIGISLGSYVRLKRTNYYQKIHTEYATGVVTNLDKSVNEVYAEGRKLLESAIPTALRNLVENARQRIDKKLQMEATKELLDRHGMFSKVSRIGLPLQEQGGVAAAKDNAIANELINALTNAKPTIPAVPPTIDTAPSTDAIQ